MWVPLFSGLEWSPGFGAGLRGQPHGAVPTRFMMNHRIP